MLLFRFIAYRTAVKVYIEARLVPNQETQRFAYMVNRNRQLILELSERLAIKYMVQCENDFVQFIETLIIVANNQLKVEKTPEYLVADVHSTRGYFVYEDELALEHQQLTARVSNNGDLM